MVPVEQHVELPCETSRLVNVAAREHSVNYWRSTELMDWYPQSTQMTQANVATGDSRIGSCFLKRWSQLEFAALRATLRGSHASGCRFPVSFSEYLGKAIRSLGCSPFRMTSRISWRSLKPPRSPTRRHGTFRGDPRGSWLGGKRPRTSGSRDQDHVSRRSIIGKDALHSVVYIEDGSEVRPASRAPGHFGRDVVRRSSVM